MVKAWASREIFFQGDKVREPITSLDHTRLVMGGRGFKSRSGQIFFQNIYSVKNMIIWGVHCQGFSPTLSLSIYISPDEWATTKQACRDELVVYLFFSSIYTSLYFFVLSTVLRKSSFHSLTE